MLQLGTRVTEELHSLLSQSELSNFFVYADYCISVIRVYVVVQFFFRFKFFLNQFKIFKLVLFFYTSLIFQILHSFILLKGSLFYVILK